MTREEAIKELAMLIKDTCGAKYTALRLAISALQKENEPAPSANDTSSMCIKKDNFNNNDTAELKKCQEAITAALDTWDSIYCALSEKEQNIWNLGVAYERLLQMIEEDKQC